MGKTFGDIARVRGVITYSISPYEQRAFAGYITKGLPRFGSMLVRNSIYFLPYIISFALIDWSKRKYEENIRKDPSIYAEVDKEFIKKH
ncbi:unnamed protein product [Gordionus sp. m RMFG-2023]